MASSLIADLKTGDTREDELFLAASDLADTTGDFFQLISLPEVTKEDALEQSGELLEVYDEYLEVLEAELQSSAPRNKTEQAVRDDLVRLHASLDYNRELLIGIFGAMQQQLSTIESEPADVFKRSVHKMSERRSR